MNILFAIIFIAAVAGAVFFGIKKKPWFMVPCILVSMVCLFMLAASIILIMGID